MESLHKLLRLLRDHYEKVLLGLALLALALSGVLLAHEKEQEEQGLQTYVANLKTRKPSLYPPVDWTLHRRVLEEGMKPVSINFSPPHNLFNPVQWMRSADGNIIKVERGDEIGLPALKLTRTTPLSLIINLDKASGASGFFVSVTREASTNRALWKKIQSYVTPGSKDRTSSLILKEAKGDRDNPVLTLELVDSGEKIDLTKDKPFQRVDGYKADFFYPPQKKSFTEKRVNDTIPLQGEVNSIIDLKTDEAVVSSPNGKRITLKLQAAP